MNTKPESYSPISHHYSISKVVRAKELRKVLTPSERKLWQALKTNQLCGLHFRRQQAISGFIADFYCHRLRLVIELDGAVHDDAVDYDAERDEALGQLGMTVIRFNNIQVLQSLDCVLNQIRHTAHKLAQATEAV